MKKFYLFLSFVIALAISAKADYYIVGDFTDNSWKPNVAQYTLTYESDGVYSTVANFKVGGNGVTLLGNLGQNWGEVTRYELADGWKAAIDTEMSITSFNGYNIFCDTAPLAESEWPHSPSRAFCLNEKGNLS